ncbi:MAG TPA: superoxide dismutase [Bellilinea sp.]|nr:superoxide dismutase [Bellilinea sp.]
MTNAKDKKTPVELPKLPFAEDALAPVISAETIQYHYGKHHNAYVNALKDLIKGTDLEGKTVEEIIVATEGKADKKKIFNNAAQIWNHNFYWESLAKGLKKTDKKVDLHGYAGTLDDLKAELAEAAKTQFGSGWAWLVLEKGKLAVVKTSNAEVPWTKDGVEPLFIVDVWEHAYYIDYRNDRGKYVKTLLDFVKWESVL